jgi:hypothetical protein
MVRAASRVPSDIFSKVSVCQMWVEPAILARVIDSTSCFLHGASITASVTQQAFLLPEIGASSRTP